MIYNEKRICISDINFKININSEYYEEICDYMKNSIGNDLSGKSDFPKDIFYVVDNFQYQMVKEKIKESTVSEKIEYFKNQYCYRHYYNDFVWLVEENGEWIVNLCDEKIYIYTSNENESLYVYLLRILRSIACGYNEDDTMLLLHGAAVSHNNKGIIIIGEKGSGKTSLLMRFIGNKSEVISNDRVFISKDMDIISFPQALRVGTGTFKKENRLTNYFSDNLFFRKQDDINNDEFKYLITMEEISNIYNTVSIMKHSLDYVIIPNVKIASSECSIEFITKEKVKKQIFDKICFTPIDESFRYFWIYSPKLSIDEKCKNRKIIWEKLKNKVFIKVNYGTELETKEIIDRIMSVVNTRK